MYYRYWMHLADHGVPAHYGVRTKQWKLIYYYGKALGTSGSIDRDTEQEWELFDMVKDPHEMNNVYGDLQNAAIVAQLKAELTRLRGVYRDQDGI
jgi:arylsulfatase A-like enzyme